MRKLALVLALVAGCSEKKPELHLFTPQDYFAKDTIPNFEKEFGCVVKLDFMDSAEILKTKLDGGKSGFDVVIPSDEVMAALIAQGLLEKLDPARIPNAKNLLPRFRGLPFDPKNEYSVPYQWGTTGIAYNKEKVTPPPDSWAALWNPQWGKRATLLDDKREVLAAAMRLEGAPPQSTTKDDIARALKRFAGWKPLAYDSTPKDKLVTEDFWVSQAYSGDAVQAAQGSGGKIGYVIPKEGGTLWLDNLAVAKGSPNLGLAHQFIDYILRPDVSAAITNERYFGSPNEAALKLIKKEILENRMAYPSQEEEKRLHILPVLSQEVKKELDAAWASIRK
jgi:spermidine/putrescine transport system substrate-binding protein